MTGCIDNDITKIQFTWVDILIYKIYHIQTGGQVGFPQLITSTEIVVCCHCFTKTQPNFCRSHMAKKLNKTPGQAIVYYCLLSYFKWKFIVYSLKVLSWSSSLPLYAAIPLIILLNLHAKPEVGCVIVNSPHQFHPLNFLK